MAHICYLKKIFQVREDESNELQELANYSCRLMVPGGIEHTPGKVNVLLQSYISGTRLESFSLISDSAYIIQVKIIFFFAK